MSSSTTTRRMYIEASYPSVRTIFNSLGRSLIALEILQDSLVWISSSNLYAILTYHDIVCDGTVGTCVSYGNLLSYCFIDFLFSIGIYSLSFATYFYKSFEHINAVLMCVFSF